MLITLQILFLLLVGWELFRERFYRPRDRYLWFLMVLTFGVFGYFLYLTFKRRWVAKRKFNPKFTERGPETPNKTL